MKKVMELTIQHQSNKIELVVHYNEHITEDAISSVYWSTSQNMDGSAQAAIIAVLERVIEHIKYSKHTISL